jgi:hypothetical protein
MSNGKPLKIDHVTIAGPDLARMQQAFARLSLTTDYGGLHANGITHMALLGFRDGSYLELISAVEPGQKDEVYWGEQIVGDGGPCAWAVRVEDVAAEAARIAALGIEVDGPVYGNRRRPDETVVEWEQAILGRQGAGAKLPFMIKDITPRTWRVTPSASVVNGSLVGITAVVLGVQKLEESIALFQRVYGWPEPLIKTERTFEAHLAAFQDAPVVLAMPLSEESWLGQRLARFGESPCAYLIGTDDFGTACRQFDLAEADPWFDHSLAWFDPAKLNGVRLGVNFIQPSTGP